MALEHCLSRFYAINLIMLAILRVSLAMGKGKIECLHSDYDKFNVHSDLHLFCVYKKGQGENHEPLKIKWWNNTGNANLTVVEHGRKLYNDSDIMMEYVQVKKEHFSDGYRMTCIIENMKNETVNDCEFDVALFYTNPTFSQIAMLCAPFLVLLVSLQFIIILPQLLKLYKRRHRGLYRFKDGGNIEERQPSLHNSSVVYSRISSIYNPSMESMRPRCPTYMAVEENEIEEEVDANDTSDKDRPDLVKSGRFRKAPRLPTRQKISSSSSVNGTDCLYCLGNHQILRSRPGGFRKPLPLYTSV